MRIGGTETVIKHLVEGIDRSECDVEILCIEPRLGPFGEQLKNLGIKITNLNWLGGFDFQLIKQIRSYLSQNSVDVLHCHQYTPWFYGTLASLFISTKVIFTEHGRFYPDRSSWKRKYINPILLRFTHQVTAISKATKLALSEYEFIPKSKVQVIYNGIMGLDCDEAEVTRLKERYKITSKDTVFGTVARLDPIKNQTMMIKAFAKVADESQLVKLIIVGDGEERNNLEALVEELNIQNSVIFTGYEAQPKNLISLIDIFLLSSLSEGTSMTLLEAMSLGKPCVVTDAGGNKEVILDGVNGVVTENKNCDEFSKGMSMLLTNSEKRNEMSTNAKARFNKVFTVNQMVKQFSNIYREC